MKDESMDISVSLHETEEITKTFHPLSVILPLVEKASTVVDAITSPAAKFSLHDIFRKGTEAWNNELKGSEQDQTPGRDLHKRPDRWVKRNTQKWRENKESKTRNGQGVE
ncbi:hypothetical protein V6N12_033355 [Hibiscus sabdariffa]|uniref:Uncharacterized protein n=1 Tax=Hibiscus sabdariffa TaxID=183260 RepID=A0ABR2BVM3_9ROSI